MEVAFDHIAESYDREFTYSHIGMLQRRRVWNYLEAQLPTDHPFQVLELNCGTGEDAAWMARHGHFVLATDASAMMVHATTKKAKRLRMSHMVASRQMAIEELGQQRFAHKFDLVFSNFGGLNCVDKAELNHLSNSVAKLLRPNGRFIAVVMSNNCIWETSYFAAKFSPKKAFRRKRQEVSVNLDGRLMNTYYFSPKSITSCFEKRFEVRAIRPVGLFVPPSYLEPFFKKRLKLLSGLNFLDSKTRQWGFTAGMADHFLIDLRLKE